MQKIVIGTRGSDLALAQTEMVKAQLIANNPGLIVSVRIIKTEGDRKQDTALEAQSDKKDWISDLERALINKEIDLAVHSAKDVPADTEQGTEIHSIMKRATPYDAFIGKRQANGSRLAFAELPRGACIGTASLRRRASLLSYRNDLVVRDHRGNVPTRLRKLDESADLSGIVLAAAGLERLGRHDIAYEQLDCAVMLPSMNQGILAVQIRNADPSIRALIESVVDQKTAVEFAAERAVAGVLGGDCHSAISIFAQVSAGEVSISARVFTEDAFNSVSHSARGPIASATDIGRALAKELIEKSA